MGSNKESRSEELFVLGHAGVEAASRRVACPELLELAPQYLLYANSSPLLFLLSYNSETFGATASISYVLIF